MGEKGNDYSLTEKDVNDAIRIALRMLHQTATVSVCQFLVGEGYLRDEVIFLAGKINIKCGDSESIHKEAVMDNILSPDEVNSILSSTFVSLVTLPNVDMFRLLICEGYNEGFIHKLKIYLGLLIA